MRPVGEGLRGMRSLLTQHGDRALATVIVAAALALAASTAARVLGF